MDAVRFPKTRAALNEARETADLRRTVNADALQELAEAIEQLQRENKKL